MENLPAGIIAINLKDHLVPIETKKGPCVNDEDRHHSRRIAKRCDPAPAFVYLLERPLHIRVAAGEHLADYLGPPPGISIDRVRTDMGL
jgi:hypothetical protein